MIRLTWAQMLRQGAQHDNRGTVYQEPCVFVECLKGEKYLVTT